MIAHYADVELASAPPGVEDHTSSRSEDDSSLKLPGEARVIWNAREFETYVSTWVLSIHQLFIKQHIYIYIYIYIYIRFNKRGNVRCKYERGTTAGS